MNYPSIKEYIDAIRFAEDNFDQLKHLRPVLGEDGEPVMTSGNFAVVFQMKDEQTGKLYAVKCFLREQEGRAEAYRQIAEELEFVSSTFLTPIKYLDKELFVDTNAGDDKEFPVLLMDWVEGDTLDKYIRKHLIDQYELSLLAYQFSRLAMWLMPQPFAHGDLKPDNILVKSDGTLVLVDYDGMYVPAMKGQKARELGSPDFRHPSRTETDFDEHIDDFSLASILLSLKAISLQPSLLEEYGAQDRLLFSEKDYRNISGSEALDALKPLMQDAELSILLLIFNISAFQKNLSLVSIRFLNLSKPNALQYCTDYFTPIAKETGLAIYGKIEYIGGSKYLLIYDINSIFDVIGVEDEAIDGLRIIEFTYKKYFERISKNYRYVKHKSRYGLVNDQNELVSNYHYTSLVRQSNGYISASYPDPCNRYGEDERFNCILNTKGKPLFEYSITTKEGNKQSRTCALNNCDAVSSCYHGIALFVRNHKIGIVDYKGNILIKPIYDDVKIDRNNNWLTTVLYDEEHYEGFDARPAETLANSTTYLFYKKNYWPLNLYSLDEVYYVVNFDKGLYYLKNKKNSLTCVCLYDGNISILSPEYENLRLLDFWYFEEKHIDALHIAINSEGKYGIISMPTGYDKVNPDTGEPLYNDVAIVCPFIYDDIANGRDDIIIVKNGREGLYSCSMKKVLLDCVIPTIDQYNYSIIPGTLGEGLIGCREINKIDSFYRNRYFFSDLNGKRVLELPLGWEIISAFNNGIAHIELSDTYSITSATVDLLGKITIIKEEHKKNDYDSYDDVESMYRDAFEDDPNMEWNID
jgi:serine/threonine protein kinase